MESFFHFKPTVKQQQVLEAFKSNFDKKYSGSPGPKLTLFRLAKYLDR